MPRQGRRRRAEAGIVEDRIVAAGVIGSPGRKEDRCVSGDGAAIGDGLSAHDPVKHLSWRRTGRVEGGGQNFGNGIYATAVGTLVVENTIVRNFSEGIYILSTVNARLVVRGGAVRNMIYGIDIEDNARATSRLTRW